MIKILHSADWHLDTPFAGRTADETGQLRAALLGLCGLHNLPGKPQQGIPQLGGAPLQGRVQMPVSAVQ